MSFRRRNDIEVASSDPFKTDKLGYRDLIPPLTRLLEKTPGPYVIAINAEYGLGKTTFLRMWRAFLEVEGAKTLFFDAWAHDFIEPPLTALIGEIEGQVRGAKGIGESADKLHKAGIAAIGALAPLGAKEVTKFLVALMAGAVGGPALSGAAGEIIKKLGDGGIGNALGEAVAGAMHDRIRQYEEEKKTLTTFRESLKEFARLATSSESAAAKNRFLPLVFFIDELDRCRPDYALELLETLKHLFAVEGVVFVLGINREALAHAVQAVYGQEFKGADYLRRFIDLQYNLPRPPLDAFCRQLADEYIPKRTSTLLPATAYYGWANADRLVPYRDIFAATTSHFCVLLGRSLRDLEQIYASAGAALATLNEGEDVEPAYYAYLMLVHEAAPRAFHAFVDGGSATELDDALRRAFPTHVAHGIEPLQVIISECLKVQHMEEREIQKKVAELDEKIRDPGFDEEGKPYRRYSHNDERFIRWALLANGGERIRATPKLVKFAKRFDQSHSH